MPIAESISDGIFRLPSTDHEFGTLIKISGVPYRTFPTGTVPSVFQEDQSEMFYKEGQIFFF